MKVQQFVLLGVVAIMAVLVVSTAMAGGGGKWNVKGTFVEGCSCSAPCTCEMMGDLEHGCQGVGAMSIDKGSFNGVDLHDVKIAYATTPGEWTRVYVDAHDSKQRDAATEFAKSYYKGFGPVEAASKAKIDIAGDNGKYTVTIDDGKIMTLTTEPVLGGDKKTPVTHTNTFSKLNPTVMQGKTVAGKFSDGERMFELKGSNSYYNTKMNATGTLE